MKKVEEIIAIDRTSDMEFHIGNPMIPRKEEV
jgi:hypothetical protein